MKILVALVLMVSGALCAEIWQNDVKKTLDVKDLRQTNNLLKALLFVRSRIQNMTNKMGKDENRQTDDEGLTGSRQKAADIVLDNGEERSNNVDLGTNPDEDPVEVRIQEMQAHLQASGTATTSNLLHGAAEAMARLGITAPESFRVVDNDTKKSLGKIRRLNMEERTAFSFARFTSWERGIVPWVFDEQSPEDSEGRSNIVAAMQYLETVSCLQFPQWTPDTQRQYNLSHNARISFVKTQNSCWSYLGRITSNGTQPVAACGDTETALHEILHAMAGRHEQSRSDRDEWIQILWDNIDYNARHNFESDATDNLVPYDYSSVMQYSLTSFSPSSSIHSMEVYDTDLEFLVGSRESLLSHNDISAINKAYGCKEQECPSFSLKCLNHGFVAYINHKCQCVCPNGLGGPTCDDIHIPESPTIWPRGSYTIPQTNDGCPEGLSSGTRLQSQKSSSWVKWTGTPHWPQGSYTTNTFNHHFCTSEDVFSSESDSYDWPSGTYCIYRKNGMCPTGFDNGHIRYDDDNSNNNQNTISGTVPDGQFDRDTTFQFCCRSDAPASFPIKLPRCSSFFMFTGYASNQCQKVEGMSVTAEEYLLSTEGNNEFQLPYPHFSQWMYEFYDVIKNVYCYYRPKEYDCGYVVTLDDFSPTWTLKYPHFGNYDNDRICHWLIKSPEDTIIKLEFSDFEVASNIDGSCEDFLEIRHHTITTPGARYCGQRFVRSMTTNDNYLMLVFESSGSNTAKGFTAHMSKVDYSALAYDPQTRGRTYAGTVSYTQHYKRCLRWDQVSQCPVNLYNDTTGTLGSHNYCRNPNSAEQPWCYISEECKTDYCDVSGINNCYDLETGCVSKVTTSYCGTEEAFERCHLSCGFCGEGVQTKRYKDFPVSMASCGPAPDMVMAHITGAVKDLYTEGDTVHYRCNNGSGSQVRTCMSDGSWSGTDRMCGACPPRYLDLLGSCYRVGTDHKSWTEARNTCQSEGTDLVIINSKEEQEGLNKIVGAHDVWIGLSDVRKEGDFTWIDGSLTSYTNWKSDLGATGEGINCVVMDQHNSFTWDDEDCGVYWYNGYICEGHIGAVCFDHREDCSLMLEEDDDLCLKQPVFSASMCRMTCGLC